MRILVVEDNHALVASIFEYFEARGHVLDAAPDGATALYVLEKNEYDALVIDWGLPRMDGMAVVGQYRREHGKALPILMLTARAELDDKLEGFRSGVNDYLTKPFAMPELEARLLALVDRPGAAPERRVLRVGDLKLDLATHEVTRAGHPIRLYRACRKLLEALMRASPAVVPREDLAYVLWGDAPPDTDLLRSHMYELRRAVDGPFECKLLHTVPREGYRLGPTGG